MAAGGGINQKSKRQPASAGLSPVSANRRGRRVKHYYLPISFKKRLRVSLRKYRQNRSRLSKKYRQYVIKTNLFDIRELSLAVIPKGEPTQKDLQPRPIFMRRPAFAAALLLLAGIGGIVFSLTHLDHRVSLVLKPQSGGHSVVLAQAVKTMPKSIPVHLKIPAIGVDTDIVKTGLNQQGTIAIPDDVHLTAWFDGSPTPGQLGPSIIVGHVDNYYQGVGALFRLRDLQPGDMVSVTRADGTIANFKIFQMKEYSQSNFPTQEVYGPIGYAGLRVITCGGTFNTVTHEYEDNIVAYGALQ